MCWEALSRDHIAINITNKDIILSTRLLLLKILYIAVRIGGGDNGTIVF